MKLDFYKNFVEIIKKKGRGADEFLFFLYSFNCELKNIRAPNGRDKIQISYSSVRLPTKFSIFAILIVSLVVENGAATRRLESSVRLKTENLTAGDNCSSNVNINGPRSVL